VEWSEVEWSPNLATLIVLFVGRQESRRKVALLEAMVLTLREKLDEEETHAASLSCARQSSCCPSSSLAVVAGLCTALGQDVRINVPGMRVHALVNC
jgi:hypothetical protein